MMKITPKKLKVLTLLAQGWSDKEIAQIMKVSPRTINTHISTILMILNAKNRTNAVFIYKNLHPNWQI